MSSGLRTGLEPQLSGNDIILTGDEPVLGGSRRPQVNLELFWDLLSSNPSVRREAARRVRSTPAAGRFYGQALVHVLVPGSRYRRLMWRARYTFMHKSAALASLSQVDSVSALNALRIAQQDPNPSVRATAIAILGNLEGAEAEQVVLCALDDPSTLVRNTALGVMAIRWKEPRLEQIVSKCPAVALQAAQALVQDANTQMLRPLLAALRNQRDNADNASARGTIVTVLSRLAPHLGQEGLTLIVEALRELLEEPELDYYISFQAVRALKAIGTKEARAVTVGYLVEHGQELSARLPALVQQERTLLSNDKE